MSKKGKAKDIKKAEALLPEPATKTDPKLFSISVAVLFFILGIFGAAHHEPWRDEYQAWLIARDAHSIPQLFANLKYDFHPMLWHFLLFVIQVFTDSIWGMKLLHVLFATGFVYVFCRYSTFNMLEKVLFSFGYYSLYEYCLVSRNYGLGIFFIFTVCALYKRRHDMYLLMGGLLALACNSSIYGLMLASGLALVLLADRWFNRSETELTPKQSRGQWLGLGVFVIGALFAFYQIIPKPGYLFSMDRPKEVFELLRFKHVFSRMVTSYFQLPNFKSQHFWNWCMYIDDERKLMDLVYPFILFTLCILVFLRKPMAMLFFLFATFGVLTFEYLTLRTEARFSGHLLVIFVTALWLGGMQKDKLNYANGLVNKLASAGKYIQMILVPLILLTGMVGGVIAYTKDSKINFSSMDDAGKYIVENKLDTIPMIGATDYVISPLSYYTQKPFFAPQRKSFQTFMIWNNERKESIGFQDILNSLDSMTKVHPQVLFVLNTQPKMVLRNGDTHYVENENIMDGVGVTLLKSFKAGIVKDEEYYIYLAKRSDK